MHESILIYRGFRYLKLSAGMAAVAILAYAVHRPEVGPPNGGTALGYVLGIWGLGLIVWLAWFGVRKRRYGVGKQNLEDWLSAHVYLGLGLIVIATLHAGFQFGWNVHLLAYVLLMLVIASGIFGVYAYARYPTLITENRRGLSLREMMAQIAELDVKARAISATLGDNVHHEVMNAAEALKLGGSVLSQLRGRDRNCPAACALQRVRGLALDLPAAETEKGHQLIELLARKVQFVDRARRDLRFKAMMDVWLYVHVPLTFALMAALTAHVVSVFFYW
jgi:hypothetical protein